MPFERMLVAGLGPVLLELFAPRLISYLPESLSNLFPAAEECASVLPLAAQPPCLYLLAENSST